MNFIQFLARVEAEDAAERAGGRHLHHGLLRFGGSPQKPGRSCAAFSHRLSDSVRARTHVFGLQDGQQVSLILSGHHSLYKNLLFSNPSNRRTPSVDCHRRAVHHCRNSGERLVFTSTLASRGALLMEGDNFWRFFVNREGETA